MLRELSDCRQAHPRCATVFLLVRHRRRRATLRTGAASRLSSKASHCAGSPEGALARLACQAAATPSPHCQLSESALLAGPASGTRWLSCAYSLTPVIASLRVAVACRRRSQVSASCSVSQPDLKHASRPPCDSMFWKQVQAASTSSSVQASIAKLPHQLGRRSRLAALLRQESTAYCAPCVVPTCRVAARRRPSAAR